MSKLVSHHRYRPILVYRRHLVRSQERIVVPFDSRHRATRSHVAIPVVRHQPTKSRCVIPVARHQLSKSRFVTPVVRRISSPIVPLQYRRLLTTRRRSFLLSPCRRRVWSQANLQESADKPLGVGPAPTPRISLVLLIRPIQRRVRSGRSQSRLNR